MNILQQAALRAGVLVYAMDQSNTPALTQPGPWGAVSGGYCAGLAMRWIALRYAAYDYPYNRKTHLAEIPDWQATRDQNVLVDVYAGKFPDDYKTNFAQYGLKLNSGMVTMTKAAMSGAALRRAGAGKEGCYFIVIRGRAQRPQDPNPAHAVAMQNMGAAGWLFFDANFGEFRFQDAAAFEAFIGWFMRESGYLTNGFLAVSCDVVGVDPPPYTGANFSKIMENLKQKLDR
jgi:hypothetical protein